MAECEGCGVGLPRGRKICKQCSVRIVGLENMCTRCGDAFSVAKGLCRRCYTYDRRKANVRLSSVDLLDCRLDWEPRFWGNVLRSDGCWEWQGTLSKQDYGMMGIGDHSYGAHRLSYLLEHGVPEKEVIMHMCDNPRCVNPAHLMQGSYQDNMNDMWLKGRGGSAGWPKGVVRRGQKNNRMLTYDGRTQCISDWSIETGISRGVIGNRLRRGWKVEAVLTTPVGGKRK